MLSLKGITEFMIFWSAVSTSVLSHSRVFLSRTSIPLLHSADSVAVVECVARSWSGVCFLTHSTQGWGETWDTWTESVICHLPLLLTQSSTVVLVFLSTLCIYRA